MFGNALHMSLGPRARTPKATDLRPARRAVTRFIVGAAWVTLVAASFLAWLMSGPGSDSVSGRGAACVSFGPWRGALQRFGRRLMEAGVLLRETAAARASEKAAEFAWRVRLPRVPERGRSRRGSLQRRNVD